MNMQVTIKVDKCSKCNGTGIVEQCEYTPPFERFKGQCDKCNGVGLVQSK